MEFNLQDDIGTVGTFAEESIIDFASRHGHPSIMVFDVHGVHGQIHVYASTTLTIDNFEEMFGQPIPYIADIERWSDAYDDDGVPVYKQTVFDANGGDGAFNDVIAKMVADAVKETVSRLPAEIRPETIFVQAAIDSAGTFYDHWQPTKE